MKGRWRRKGGDNVLCISRYQLIVFIHRLRDGTQFILLRVSPTDSKDNDKYCTIEKSSNGDMLVFAFDSDSEVILQSYSRYAEHSVVI